MTSSFLYCVSVCVLSWENKDIYARAVRNLRLRELQNVECMTAVRAGLSSIIPLQLLTMLTPLEMELRTCGLPYINLEFLKVMNIFFCLWNLILHCKTSGNIPSPTYRLICSVYRVICSGMIQQFTLQYSVPQGFLSGHSYT